MIIPFLNRANLCLGALFALVVSATSAMNETDLVKTTVLDLYAKSAGQVSMRDAAASFQSGVELRTQQDDSTVSLRWGTPIADKDRFVAFTASAPLDEANANTALANLDGLSHAVTFEAKYNWFWGDGRESFRSGKLLGARGISEDPSRAEWIKKRILMRKSGNLEKGLSATDALKSQENSNSIADSIVKKTTLLSFSAKAGYKSFDYLDPTTLDDKSSEKTIYSGRFSYSKFVWNDSAWAFEFEYQDAFKAAEEKSFALPAGTNGFQEVKTGAVGAPTPSIQRLYSLEFRQRGLLFLDRGSFAVRLTYDQVKDVYGVRIPVYFIQDNDGVSNGGIELGWTSHHDKNNERIVVTFMIGAGVKLLPYRK